MRSGGAAPAEVDEVLRVLRRTGDDDLQDLLRLAAGLCDAEAAGVTIRRADQFHVPLTYGIEPFVCPADDTFCVTVMDRPDVVVVHDARQHEQYRGISWVDGTRASARFYASAPLHSPDRRLAGTALRHRPPAPRPRAAPAQVAGHARRQRDAADRAAAASRRRPRREPPAAARPPRR